MGWFGSCEIVLFIVRTYRYLVYPSSAPDTDDTLPAKNNVATATVFR